MWASSRFAIVFGGTSPKINLVFFRIAVMLPAIGFASG